MEEKRSSRYKVPFRIVFAVYGVLILACVALLAGASIDEPWWPLIWMFGGVLAAQVAVPVLAATLGVKHLLQSREGTREVADKKFDRFASVLTIVLAVLALLSTAGQYLLDPTHPWSAADLFTNLQIMSMFFGGMSVFPLVIGWILCKLKRDKRWLRVCAICLTLCITLGVLFVPTQSGKYNDGGGIPQSGSWYYKAMLYEVIVWDRTHEFNGTPVEPTEQHTRVYFFPFNNLDYKQKWEMKH